LSFIRLSRNDLRFVLLRLISLWFEIRFRGPFKTPTFWSDTPEFGIKLSESLLTGSNVVNALAPIAGNGEFRRVVT